MRDFMDPWQDAEKRILNGKWKLANGENTNVFPSSISHLPSGRSLQRLLGVSVSCTARLAYGQGGSLPYLISVPCPGAPVSGMFPTNVAVSSKIRRSRFVPKKRTPETPGLMGSAVIRYEGTGYSSAQPFGG